MKTCSINQFRAFTFLAALGFSSLLRAQTVTLVATSTTTNSAAYSTNAVVLQAGDTATIVSQYTQSGGFAAAVQIGNTEFDPPPLLMGSGGANGGPTPSQPGPVTIAGPAIICAKVDRLQFVGASSFVTVKVTPANSTTATVPLNAVVIPENATGNVSVIMESSADLITWNAANPGVYGGTTTQRFFRVRVVQQ
jgi:hypothetical protein